jgi:hypothetical protein
MVKKTSFILFALALLLAGLGSCNYDNLAELHPEINCDPTSVSFAGDIVPIISGSCSSLAASCHGPGSSKPLDTYAGVKLQVDEGKLLSSVTWDGNARQMPEGKSSKIDDCSISKITQWIADGAQNN